MLNHSYGLTTLFNDWLGFLYGVPVINEATSTANCHYGVAFGSVFIGIVIAGDLDDFIWSE
jgi:hypothetical protein